MKKSIFAVCDLEEAYVWNLTEYMNERKSTPFEVQAFTNVESLAEFAGKHSIELLLISTSAMNETIRDLNVERIIILSEGEMPDYLQHEPRVYKYQSSDSLIAEVMNYYAESGPLLHPALLEESDFRLKILGIYSPINRVGKTTFALTLGEILAESRKVLYLNLEDYNGFETILGETYRSDISDLIYFSRQKEGNLLFKLNSVIRSLDRLDYIPPAFLPCDLREVHYEEWIRFIREIGCCGEYDVLILDIGNHIEEVFQILRQCQKIYMPVLEDDFSRAKLFQFEKNLNALDYQEIWGKIHRLHLPQWENEGSGGELIARLVNGSMGDYVRRMLAEEQETSGGLYE